MEGREGGYIEDASEGMDGGRWGDREGEYREEGRRWREGR